MVLSRSWILKGWWVPWMSRVFCWKKDPNYTNCRLCDLWQLQQIPARVSRDFSHTHFVVFTLQFCSYLQYRHFGNYTKKRFNIYYFSTIVKTKWHLILLRVLQNMLSFKIYSKFCIHSKYCIDLNIKLLSILWPIVDSWFKYFIVWNIKNTLNYSDWWNIYWTFYVNLAFLKTF